MELSWTKNRTQIDLMLKTAYGAEILRFPIEFNDFSSFRGSSFDAKIDRIRCKNGWSKKAARQLNLDDFEGHLGANMTPSWAI